MKKPDIRKMYSKLTTDEKFRLIINLRSQNKIDEVERIVDSYEPKDYFVADKKLFKRHEALNMIVNDFCLFWLMMDRFQQNKILDNVLGILYDIDRSKKIPENFSAIVEEYSDFQQFDFLKGMIDAFDEFCIEYGFEGDYILTFCPCSSILQAEIGLYRKYEKTEGSRRYEEDYRKKIVDMWDAACNQW